MSGGTLARFQEASVRHIVERLEDRQGPRRMLLADEVGLGKTVVARGVLEALIRRRRRPLTVMYLCSNVEIAEQNRTKLDPNSRKPIGRVTELALDRPDSQGDLLLYSFTYGTSLKDGTGLAWERRLLLYLLHRLYQWPVGKKRWREFFRCGAGEDNWRIDTTPTALSAEFERKTSVTFQTELAAAFRKLAFEGAPAIPILRAMPWEIDLDSREQRAQRNQLISRLRGEMQRVALRHLEPDLIILDEVQRFRDVIEQVDNPAHIAAELFSRRVPVLILSATPYRALTLAHELAEGVSSHYEDFLETLGFLFDKNVETPKRIRDNLASFGERLKSAAPGARLDQSLLSLKRELEQDLTKVICRTERNRYVLDRRHGIDDSSIESGAIPGKEELEEFFRLHKTLSSTTTMGLVTEFWKSAPSLLTFLDSHYQLYRNLRDRKIRVPRALLTPADETSTLAKRNHRISGVLHLALGTESLPPRLWIAPTYTYYRDDFFGEERPRKVLVFSAWRFVPRTVAILTSSVARARLGGLSL